MSSNFVQNFKKRIWNMSYMSFFQDQEFDNNDDPFSVSDNCFDFDMMDQYERDDNYIDLISASENTSTAQSLLTEDYPYIMDVDIPHFDSTDESHKEFSFEAVKSLSESNDTSNSYDVSSLQKNTTEEISTPKQITTTTKRKYTKNKNDATSYTEKISKSREAARKFRKKQLDELEALQKRAEELTKENQLYAEEEKRMVIENEVKRKEAEEMYQKLQALISFTFSQITTASQNERILLQAKQLGIDTICK